MRTRGQRAGARAAMVMLLLLLGGIPSAARTDRGTINVVRWTEQNTNIASGAAIGSATGTQPARTMPLDATFNL